MRKEKVAEATSNREESTMKRMADLAVKMGFLKQNPFRDLEPLPEGNAKEGCLQLDEIDALLRAINVQWVRAFVELLIRTGMRTGEMLAFMAEDIKWELRYMEVKTEKQERKKRVLVIRRLLLTRRIRELLLILLGDRRAGFVFCDKTGKQRTTPTGTILRALLKAGLITSVKKEEIPKDGRWITRHDFRDTFAAHHAMFFKEVWLLKYELGHSSLVTMTRYVDKWGALPRGCSIFSRDSDEDPEGTARRLLVGLSAHAAFVNGHTAVKKTAVYSASGHQSGHFGHENVRIQEDGFQA